MWGIECLLLIPFIVYFKILHKGEKSIFYYLLSSITLASGSIIIALIWRNNMWFLSIMYFVQFVILSLFFHRLIKNTFVKRCIIIFIPPVFIVFLTDLLKLEGTYTFNSYFVSIRTFILLLYGFVFFWQLLRDNELIKSAVFINSLPSFWYNSGLFIYHCGSFMLSLTYNLLQQEIVTSASTTNVTLSISYIAAIIQLILFYIGLMKAKRMWQ